MRVVGALLSLGDAADGAVIVEDQRDVAGQADKGLRKLRGPGRQAAEVRCWLERWLHVDAFADRVVGFFQHGQPLSRAEVRGAGFRAQLRGYTEAQVDAVLDDLVRVMLAVK